MPDKLCHVVINIDRTVGKVLSRVAFFLTCSKQKLNHIKAFGLDFISVFLLRQFPSLLFGNEQAST